MKKYAAAGAAAVMVFGITAFAASFNVDESVLATGIGDVTDCGNVEVVDYAVDAAAGTFSSVTVGIDENDCFGTDTVIVASFRDGSGAEVANSDVTAFPATGNAITLPVDAADIAPVQSVRFSVYTAN